MPKPSSPSSSRFLWSNFLGLMRSKSRYSPCSIVCKSFFNRPGKVKGLRAVGIDMAEGAARVEGRVIPRVFMGELSVTVVSLALRADILGEIGAVAVLATEK